MYLELKETLQGTLQKAVENKEVMGVNLLVEKSGMERIYCQAGMADREKGTQMSEDTIFRLYSQTKPVTAAAAMLLMERGELDFYQRVAEILPSFGKIKSVRPMLVHDLLKMTSGLAYPDETTEAGRASAVVFDEACARLDSENPMGTQELADRLAEGPLLDEPGAAFNYGTSADVLGAVIEKISGKRFSEFLREEIFEPLEMNDTGFWVPAEKQNRLAAAYETVTGEDGSREMVRYTGNNLAVRNDMAKPPVFESGGAGLASTLGDYMKFAGMLLNGGEWNGKRILKTETVKYLTGGELMPAQQEAFRDWVGLDGFSYGNLMRVCKNPAQCGMLCREGEYGWDGWLGTYFASFPKEKMTILIGLQKKDEEMLPLTRKIRNIILSRI